jgi:hypothetical protein
MEVPHARGYPSSKSEAEAMIEELLDESEESVSLVCN